MQGQQLFYVISFEFQGFRIAAHRTTLKDATGTLGRSKKRPELSVGFRPPAGEEGNWMVRKEPDSKEQGLNPAWDPASTEDD